MNNPLLLPLLVVVVVLVVVFALLQLTRKKKRSRRKKWKSWWDHGARIARRHGQDRSSEWASVAREHRLREPACVVCGYKGRKLQVHHIKPFHLHPQLELDPDNLITLCEARGKHHHFLLGHLGSWDSYNEHIRADVKHYYRKTSAEIKADIRWLKKMKLRP